MASPFRPLLPRDNEGNHPGQHSLPAQKRRQINIACHSCRSRKSKCDGARPVCGSCAQRDLSCVYTQGRRRPAPQAQSLVRKKTGGDHLDLLSRLRTLPLSEATELLRSIRNQVEAPSFPHSPPAPPAPPKAHIPGPPVGPPVSDHDIMRSLLPSTPNGFEFELTARHSIPFPTLYPISVTAPPMKDIVKPTLVHQLRILESWPSQGLLADADGQMALEPGSPLRQQFPTRQIDYRLRRVEISKWTSIPISNDLAARVISHYLDVDHPVLPLFDADLFVNDFAHHRSDFCSRLLVSALISWSCNVYKAVDPEAERFCAPCFEEAQQLLRAEASRNSLTTVCALQLLCMNSVTYGRDDKALNFLQEGVKMGKAMGLFSSAWEGASPISWLNNHPRWRKAASYTAWGVYNWICVHSLHYHRAEIEQPPVLPRPGDIDIEIAAQSGTTVTLDTHTEVFRSSCGLWTIFNDVIWKYYDRDGTEVSPKHLPPDFAETTFRRLLQWADNLPLALVRSSESGHAVMMMHVYFHAVMMNLFRPLVQSKQRLVSFHTTRATPEAAYAASVNQLKRLLIIYRIKFKRETLSVLWQTGLVYVANAMVHEAGTNSGTEWKYYLQLCMAGLEDLYFSYRVFGSVAKGMLAMAYQSGALSIEEITRYSHELAVLRTSHHGNSQLDDMPEVANWIVDLEGAVEDPTSAQGTNLSRKFEALGLVEPREIVVPIASHLGFSERSTPTHSDTMSI